MAKASSVTFPVRYTEETPQLLVDDGELWVSSHCLFSSNGSCWKLTVDLFLWWWIFSLAAHISWNYETVIKTQQTIVTPNSWSFPLTSFMKEIAKILHKMSLWAVWMWLFKLFICKRVMVYLTRTCVRRPRWKIKPPTTRWFTYAVTLIHYSWLSKMDCRS